MYPAAMTYAPSGHIEQLPSGSWRAKVYAGKEVRKVRGQLLDTLYARLQKCGESVVLPVRRAVQAQPLVVVRLGVLTPTGVGVLALLG